MKNNIKRILFIMYKKYIILDMFNWVIALKSLYNKISVYISVKYT